MIRGRDVSRIEGFSDAVFGFALTLLVASIEVPPDFEALKLTLRGFLPFALTFALICWIWYLHYQFFRTYGLQDRLTIVLNCVLLFVVLFFVYPLKVVANNLVPLVTGIGDSGFRYLTEYDNRFLMVCYSSGVVSVFLIFLLLNWNAYRQRDALALSP
ncbi:MAG: TMEM175 family protein, partial [Vicinamibacterales bacterium]